MNKKLIIGIVVVLVLGLGGWKIWTNSSGGDAEEKQTTTDVAEDKVSNKDTEKKDTEKLEENSSDDSVDNIDMNESTGSEKDSNVNTSQDETTNRNDLDNKENTNSNILSSINIKTPYNVSVTGMQISKIDGFSGTFVEDGSDKKVRNILSLEVKNTAKKDLQYGEIKLKINDKKIAVFKLTNLPAGKTVKVIESTGSIPYNFGDNYKYEDATYATVDEFPMNKNKVKVIAKDSSITIENISNKNLGTIYVYYKNLDKSGNYLGGITYRAKFDDVKEGETLSQNTKHFSSSNSKVIMVDTEN
ncbi:hypothetical protein [Terrisporobacter sp.]